MLIFFKAIPIGVQVLFAIPWIIGILALSLPIFLVLMWIGGNASRWERFHYVVMTTATFALVWQANFWHLVLR